MKMYNGLRSRLRDICVKRASSIASKFNKSPSPKQVPEYSGPLIKMSLLFIITAVMFACTTAPIESISDEVPEISLYEEFISRAEAGDEEAMVQVGISYEEGNGVLINYDKAYEWYKSAAAKGNSHAYFRIGRCYEEGISVEKDQKSALDWFLSAAATGFPGAIIKLINYYENSPEDQLEWIKKGIEIQDPYSNYRYGLILEEDDKNRSLEYFRKAEKSDNREIRGLLSILSLSGQYLFYSDELSLGYIHEAAEAGHKRSQTFLGWLFEYGIFEKQNYDKAFNLYKAAAESDEVLAIYNLSRFYGEGLFPGKNPHLSNKYFKKLENNYYSPVLEDLIIFCRNRNLKDQLVVLYRLKAAGNDLDAYYNLGMLSGEADGFHWFNMAADSGHIKSMFELGKLYYNEKTSDFNPVKAAAWLMVYENRSGIISEDISSNEILNNLSDEEKVEVSRLFTTLFYNKESSEQETEFLR